MDEISRLSSLIAVADQFHRQNDWALKLIDNHFDLASKMNEDAMQLSRFATEMTAQWEETFSLLNDRTADILKSFETFDSLDRRFLEWSQRWATALSVLHKELPKRGWYLIGKEDFPLTKELVLHIEAKDWKALDDALVSHAADFSVDAANFTQSLRELGVREYTIGRVRLFLEAREASNHEVATLIGVPLIDELCRSLHNGKDFTTKRGKQPKPQLGSVLKRLNSCAGRRVAAVV